MVFPPRFSKLLSSFVLLFSLLALTTSWIAALFHLVLTLLDPGAQLIFSPVLENCLTVAENFLTFSEIILGGKIQKNPPQKIFPAATAAATAVAPKKMQNL